MTPDYSGAIKKGEHMVSGFNHLTLGSLFDGYEFTESEIAKLNECARNLKPIVLHIDGKNRAGAEASALFTLCNVELGDKKFVISTVIEIALEKYRINYADGKWLIIKEGV